MGALLETELDLDTVVLYGWEASKLASDVGRYRAMLREGLRAPPVYVVPLGDGAYSLDLHVRKGNGWRDGGHRRAIAHWLERVPLPVYERLQGGAVSAQDRVRISDVRIVGGEYAPARTRLGKVIERVDRALADYSFFM